MDDGESAGFNDGERGKGDDAALFFLAPVRQVDR